jgi:muconate cycloisomerase
MIPRGDPQGLASVQASTAISQMADESLITLADAEALIEAGACRGFNLRLAKCGGLGPTLAIAELAAAAGISVQVGCQVGETAILSAAGRHLAAYLPEISFCEGSYGSLLLREDLSRRPIHFGHQGLAKPLKGPGLGVEIQDALLEKYAQQIISLSAKAV